MTVKEQPDLAPGARGTLATARLCEPYASRFTRSRTIGITFVP